MFLVKKIKLLVAFSNIFFSSSSGDFEINKVRQAFRCEIMITVPVDALNPSFLISGPWRGSHSARACVGELEDCAGVVSSLPLLSHCLAAPPCTSLPPRWESTTAGEPRLSQDTPANSRGRVWRDRHPARGSQPWRGLRLEGGWRPMAAGPWQGGKY